MKTLNIKKTITVLTAITLTTIAFASTNEVVQTAGWPTNGIQYTTIEPEETKISWGVSFPSTPDSNINAIPILAKSDEEKKWEKRFNMRRKKSKAEAPDNWLDYFSPVPNREYYKAPADSGVVYEEYSAKKILPIGMFMEGEDTCILYQKFEHNQIYKSLRLHYDYINDLTNKSVHFNSISNVIGSKIYLQIIDEEGNLKSEKGIELFDDQAVVAEGTYGEKYHWSYFTDGSSNLVSMDLDIKPHGSYSMVGLLDVGKEILIYGKTLEAKIFSPWTFVYNTRENPILDGALYYLENSELKRVDFDSWCSGRYINFGDRDFISGRAGKYLHVIGEGNTPTHIGQKSVQNRVWRLSPR